MKQKIHTSTVIIHTEDMRVDKWVWAVRMVKSRTLAGQLCRQGRVTVNQQKAKPATNLKIGDVVEMQNKQVTKIYQVTGFIPKRVSAELAAKNYTDLSPEPDTKDRSQGGFLRFWGRRPKGEGRPTKKDWRDIEQSKRGDE